jgi:hypothetical protein
MPHMTCEDQQPARITWLVELYEPFSQVWICRGLGHATTTADPEDVARAVLAGYLAATPNPYGETFRATVHTDTSGPVTVTPEQLAGDGWIVEPAVRQALPLFLRDALPGG